MTFRSSPIPDFLCAFGDGSAESLEPFLHEDVAYRVDGFEPVIGRRAVLAFWRRMFTAHDAVRMSLERQVRDGDVVIAAQRQLYLAGRRQPLRFDSFVIYELEDERIRDSSDRLQLVPGEGVCEAACANPGGGGRPGGSRGTDRRRGIGQGGGPGTSVRKPGVSPAIDTDVGDVPWRRIADYHSGTRRCSRSTSGEFVSAAFDSPGSSGHEPKAPAKDCS